MTRASRTPVRDAAPLLLLLLALGAAHALAVSGSEACAAVAADAGVAPLRVWLAQVEVSRAAVLRGDLWRLCSAPFFHASAAHLVGNAVAIALLGRPLLAVWGPWGFALLATAGAFGSTLGVVAASDLAAVGASGIVTGLLGASLAFAMRWVPADLAATLGRPRLLAAVLVITATALALLSAAPGASHAGHAGGWLAGFGAGLGVRPASGGGVPGRPWHRPLTLTLLCLLAAGLLGAVGVNWRP